MTSPAEAIGAVSAQWSARTSAERTRFVLLVGLFAIAAVVAIPVDLILASGGNSVDIEIPLRAAERWLAGGVVYPPEAFDWYGGPELPFLYPPFTLPFFAPLTFLPRFLAFGLWHASLIAGAVFAVRRLGLGWGMAVIVLLWPPFIESLVGGNVQALLFASFVAVFFAPPGPRERWAPGPAVPVDLRADPRPAAKVGFLATIVGAIKVSQAHAWAHLLARRPRAALTGAIAILVVVLTTLPVTGTTLWFEWLGQAARSGNPGWKPVGAPLSLWIGQQLGLIVTFLTIAAAVLVRGRRAGPWVGVLTVIGAPSVHVFGLLFLLPALLVIRREVALVAAMLVATTAPVAIWVAVALIVAGMLALERTERVEQAPAAR